MNETLTIRILSKENQKVDVSWGNESVVEVYNFTSKTILDNIIQDWNIWINYVLRRNPNSKSPEGEIRSTLLKKGNTFESVLFGGKEWRLSGVKKFIFITDPNWNPLPFEILPVNNLEVLGEKFIVMRNIRSPLPVPDKKIGKGAALWVQNHPKLKSSLKIEKEALQNIFDDYNFNYENYYGNENILNRIWIALNSVEYVHFAGHSERDGIYISDNKILTHSEWEGQDLSNISLAFLNTCYSGVDYINGDGLARALLTNGVRELIGFSTLLPSEKAIHFSIEFWKSFMESKNSEQSVLITRQKINKHYSNQDITHLLMLHYSGKKINIIKKRKNITTKIIAVCLLLLLIHFANTIFHFKEEPKNEQKINPSSNINEKIPEIKSKESNQDLIKFSQKKEKSLERVNKVIDSKKNISDKSHNDLPKINKVKENKRVVQKKIELEKPSEFINPSIVKLQEAEKELSYKKESAPIAEISELQRAIEDFRTTPHPLLDTKEKEKIIKEILSKEEEDSVKRWILKKKTGF
jgi:hypothetical protein